MPQGSQENETAYGPINNGATLAVDNLSFDVKLGIVTGFLGLSSQATLQTSC